MKDFEGHCERIFEEWMKGSRKWDAFGRDFLPDHLPEPYYTIREGKRVLYVLNYNPGCGLAIQSRDDIRKHDHRSFGSVSARLSNYYMNDLRGAARNRNEKILQLARALGFDGVKCVETFYLHSAKFDANMYLKRYGNNETVIEYIGLLTDHLRDKPVVAIGAVGSNATLESLTNGSNAWLAFRSRIIGLDLANSQFLRITEKNNRATSGFFIGKNRKIASVMMGSNNLPKITAEKMAEIKKAFLD